MAQSAVSELWYEDLRAVYVTLRDGGVQSWLWLGTFLGAVRDGEIMPWDHDIDLACPWEDGDRLWPVFDHLRAAGFTVQPRDKGPGEKPFVVKITRHAPLDLLPLARIGEYRVMVKGTRRVPTLEYLTWWNEARYCENLGVAYLQGEAYPVPAPAEELLAYWYGPGWCVPAGDRSAHPARNPIRFLPQDDFLTRLEEGPAWHGTL